MDYYYSDSSCSQVLDKSPLGECNKCSVSNFPMSAHYVEIECVGFDDDSSSSNPNDSSDKPNDSSKSRESSSSKAFVVIGLMIALFCLI